MDAFLQRNHSLVLCILLLPPKTSGTSDCLSLCLSVCESANQSVSRSVGHAVSLSVRPLARLRVCLPLCVSVSISFFEEDGEAITRWRPRLCSRSRDHYAYNLNTTSRQPFFLPRRCSASLFCGRQKTMQRGQIYRALMKTFFLGKQATKAGNAFCSFGLLLKQSLYSYFATCSGTQLHRCNALRSQRLAQQCLRQYSNKRPRQSRNRKCRPRSIETLNPTMRLKLWESHEGNDSPGP